MINSPAPYSEERHFIACSIVSIEEQIQALEEFKQLLENADSALDEAVSAEDSFDREEAEEEAAEYLSTASYDVSGLNLWTSSELNDVSKSCDEIASDLLCK